MVTKNVPTNTTDYTTTTSERALHQIGSTIYLTNKHMTSLTRAKNMTRVAAMGVGVALVLYIVVRVSLNIVFSLNNDHKAAQNQAKQNLPTVAFGQITPPQLQPATVTSATATIQLDLVDGTLPQSTSSAKVYRVATPSLTLSAQDRARQRGKTLGFDSTPTQPNPVTFTWGDAWRQLSIDLSSQTFNLTTNLPQVDFSHRVAFTKTTSLVTALSSYASNLFQYKDMQFNTPQIRYVNPAGTDVLPQSDTAVDTTNFIQATFLRQKLDDRSVYAATGKFGPIKMVIIPPMANRNQTSQNSQIKLDQIVQFSSHYFPIDSDNPSTYPIINASTAFTRLQSNISQYLVSVEPTGTIQAKSFISGRVLFATLVYLEPDAKNMQYVQPAWMFEGRATTDVGEAKWIAYVPAVDQDLTRLILSTK